MPDEQGRMTNYDYAAQTPEPTELPEFRFSDKTGHRPAFRGCFEWPDEADPAPLGPPVPATLTNRLTCEPGTADPVWSLAFRLKFSPDPDPTRVLTPYGTASAFIPGLLPRAEEIAWLKATCHLELPTTLQELAANDMKSAVLDADPELEYEAANIADLHLNRTPYAVRLADEDMLTEDGRVISVPRYGDQTYINNMQRAIDWEYYRNESIRPLVAYFVAGTDPDIPDIVAESRMLKSYSDTDILEAKRAVKRNWLATHDTLPNPLTLVNKATIRVADLLSEDDADVERLLMAEDFDPWRDAHHADPDPEPRREDYAEGDCTDRCVVLPWNNPKDDEHHECDFDGWDQYHMDWALWDKRHEKEYGYAGPNGDIDFDSRAPRHPENPHNLRTRVSSYGATR